MCKGMSAQGIMYDMGYESNKEKCLGKSCCCAFLTLVLLLVILLPASLQKVGSTEVGLAYDSVWANLRESIMTEGLKTKPVFGDIILWPTDYQIIEFSGTPYKDDIEKGIMCNSKDGIQIQLQASFQFVPLQDKVYELTMNFRDFEGYKKLVTIQARSAIRHGCGTFTAQDFQLQRAKVQTSMQCLVKGYLGSNDVGYDTATCGEYYTNATSWQAPLKFHAVVKLLQLKNVDRPRSYQAAVEDKETARSDILLAKNERSQRETQAQTVKDKSVQTAKIILDTANTDANVTMAFAKADAQAVLERYQAYEQAYGLAKTNLSLSDVGILAYFGNQMVGGKAGENQTMAIPATAKVSYAGDL